MVVVNYSGKEINAKVVYYGPGLCGKTTNLERIYESVPATNKGKMISMKTKTDRTLFFDFLPIELGEIAGFRTRLMLYTVPGQVFYNATRKLVLKGVDAVVFVADSERGKMRENQGSLENLHENLTSYGVDMEQLPVVFQYNKRDLPEVYSCEELDRALGRGSRPMMEAVAAKGDGVFETLRLVSKLLLTRLHQKMRTGQATGATGATVVDTSEAAPLGASRRVESLPPLSPSSPPPPSMPPAPFSAPPGYAGSPASTGITPGAGQTPTAPMSSPSWPTRPPTALPSISQGIPYEGIEPQGIAPAGIAPPGIAPPGIAPPGIAPPGITPRGITPLGIALPMSTPSEKQRGWPAATTDAPLEIMRGLDPSDSRPTPGRITVPVEIDIADLEAGRPLELVLRIEVRDRRRVA